MKKQSILLFCTLSVGFLIGCTSLADDNGGTHVDYVPGGSGPIELRAALLPRVTQDNQFALDIFRQMAMNTGDTNIVISPLSISVAFGMAWNGAAGVTKSEIGDVFHYGDMADSLVNTYYEIMQKSLPLIDSGTTVNLANSLWYRTGFPVKSSYLQLNQDYFDAEIRSLDFSQTKAKDTINAWVADKTNQRIKTIVDNINSDVVMYLINAVYFKGIWVKQFDAKETSDCMFTEESGKQGKVKMMSMSDTLHYYSDADAKYLDLPYGNGAYSMTLVLPASGKTTTDWLETATPASLTAAIESMTKQKVEVNIPRFKMECEFGLVPVLKKLGMNIAFTNQANFKAISDESIKISDVRHKTFVEVTEEGTEAAAVTSIEFMVTSIQDPTSFVADKPFLFFIREKGTGVILFAGKVGNIDYF
jgi:serine protease inhibitor